MITPEVAYFDNAATTYIKPTEVHDFMHSFYSMNSINLRRTNHELSQNSVNIVSDTRKMLLKLFNAGTDYSVVFTATATEAINIILQGQNFHKTLNVYISPFEHNAVYRTLKYLEKLNKINIYELSVNKETLEFEFDKITYQFSQNYPDLVVVSHVSNVTGCISPIIKLGTLVNKTGSKFLIDCAQSAGILEIDINQCHADYIIFAGHKTLYGPFGCSGFVCKKTADLKPLIYGGTGLDSQKESMPTEIPERFEAGSFNILSLSGLYAALKWHEVTGKDKIYNTEINNYNRLYNLLSSFDYITIKGVRNNSISIISVLFKDIPSDIAGNILLNNHVITRTGLQCAPLAHKFIDTYPAGTIRFSISYFTSDDDFITLKNALKQIKEDIHEF
ncbi:MAG: aminotransferase class V-fold PLP-dependent enzyme [Christensenellaceae bacterium]|nr:aminotransferase class V-fold PLP-dependent enzyme [Christensenellaceae bacterium]